MSFADLQPALSTGAVDGQENPVNLFLGFKIHQLSQRHLTIWNYVADPAFFVVNKGVWEGFRPDDQKILRETAEIAGKESIAAARKGTTAQDDSSIRELRGLGVDVTVLTEAEKKTFQDATRPVFDKWVPQVGAGLVRQAQAAIEARKRS